MPALIEGRATVIQTSSAAARAFGRLDIDDLQNARRYSPSRAYGNGKLANILFTTELQRRYGGDGVAAVAFHPGVVGSNFAAETSHPMRAFYHSPLKRLFTISNEKGADQLVWLAQGKPGATFRPGAYYESRRVAKTSPQAYDADRAGGLWERSAALV